MKYVKATLKYLFSHLPKLLAISLIPAAIVAFFMEPQGFGLIIHGEALAGVKNFKDIFFLVFSHRVITKIPYILVIAFVLFLIAISYTISIVEKHFRVGKLSLRRPFANINNSFMVSLKVFSLLVIIYIAYRFLLVCLLTFVTFILRRFSLGYMWISIIMGALSIVGISGLLLLLRPLIFSAAVMLVYGYALKDSFGIAIKFSEAGDRNALNFALVLPFVIYLALTAVMTFLRAPLLVQSLAHTLLIAFLLQYVLVYALVAMFELSGIERRDRKKPYEEGRDVV